MMNNTPKQLRCNTQPDAYVQSREQYFAVYANGMVKISQGEFVARLESGQYGEAQVAGGWEVWPLVREVVQS